ncbi:hypothetical protein SK128_026829 [Halocaridina rubra]|uniref:Uncharacterized protein n=1 Tax=Halocaridina rubra TaxID=373956 RepID=A0AAN9AF99_HALRR
MDLLDTICPKLGGTDTVRILQILKTPGGPLAPPDPGHDEQSGVYQYSPGANWDAFGERLELRYPRVRPPLTRSSSADSKNALGQHSSYRVSRSISCSPILGRGLRSTFRVSLDDIANQERRPSTSSQSSFDHLEDLEVSGNSKTVGESLAASLPWAVACQGTESPYPDSDTSEVTSDDQLTNQSSKSSKPCIRSRVKSPEHTSHQVKKVSNPDSKTSDLTDKESISRPSETAITDNKPKVAVAKDNPGQVRDRSKPEKKPARMTSLEPASRLAEKMYYQSTIKSTTVPSVPRNLGQVASVEVTDIW